MYEQDVPRPRLRICAVAGLLFIAGIALGVYEAPPRVVEMPVEHRVEVPVEVPGPERVVTKTARCPAVKHARFEPAYQGPSAAALNRLEREGR